MTASTPLPGRMYPEVRGYFAFPLTPDDDSLEDLTEWQVLATLVADAKAGRVDAIATMLQLYDGDLDWVRRGAYIQLMGDAGRYSLIERIHGQTRPTYHRA